MINLLPASHITAALAGDCKTTRQLSQQLGEHPNIVRASCLAAARGGALELVHYGVDFSYAWAEPDADVQRSEYDGPWAMNDAARYSILAVDVV